MHYIPNEFIYPAFFGIMHYELCINYYFLNEIGRIQ